MAKILPVFRNIEAICYVNNISATNQPLRIKSPWDGSPWDKRTRPFQQDKACLGIWLTVGSCRPQQGLHMRTSRDHTTDEGCFLSWTYPKNALVTHTVFIDGRCQVSHWSSMSTPCLGMEWGINKSDCSLYPIAVLRESQKAGRGSWAWCDRGVPLECSGHWRVRPPGEVGWMTQKRRWKVLSQENIPLNYVYAENTSLLPPFIHSWL